MAGFNDFSTTPASNASIGAINFAEGQLPATLNNSNRQVLADLRYELGAISAAVSAGSTTDLGSVQEGVVVLSGNATIARFGATGTAGLRKKIRFTGTPTIAHSTGGIICPGSANITVAAGDTCEAICESSNVWRIYNYQPADGFIFRPIAFLANKNATNQTGIASGVGTKITFTNEVFDVGGHYVAADSKFQPTVAGYYEFTAIVRWGGSVDQSLHRLMIYKNGDDIVDHDLRASGSSGFSQQVSAVVHLNGSTDYLEVYAFHSTGSNQSVEAGAANEFAQFSGKRVA